MKGLLKYNILLAAPIPRNSDSINLGQGMKNFNSNMAPDNASGNHTKPTRICSRNYILRITNYRLALGNHRISKRLFKLLGAHLSAQVNKIST